MPKPGLLTAAMFAGLLSGCMGEVVAPVVSRPGPVVRQKWSTYAVMSDTQAARFTRRARMADARGRAADASSARRWAAYHRKEAAHAWRKAASPGASFAISGENTEMPGTITYASTTVMLSGVSGTVEAFTKVSVWGVITHDISGSAASGSSTYPIFLHDTANPLPFPSYLSVVSLSQVNCPAAA